MGRFGNQLFQYAAARGYARKIGAELQIPPWWLANVLFKNINDPIIQRPMPRLGLDEWPGERCDVDLYGYFQHKQWYDLYTISDLKHWFEFQPWVHERFKDMKPANLAAHIRRGDYATTYAYAFCTIDESCYLGTAAVYALEGPITWVREDQPRPFDEKGLKFLLDFYILMTAEVLIRANSTFSFWAALLGDHREVYSPVIDGLRGHCNNVTFVKGNYPRTSDHPGVHNYEIQP